MIAGRRENNGPWNSCQVMLTRTLFTVGGRNSLASLSSSGSSSALLIREREAIVPRWRDPMGAIASGSGFISATASLHELVIDRRRCSSPEFGYSLG